MHRVAPLALALTACFSPKLGDTPFVCGDTDPRCPSGYHCASDGFCWSDGMEPVDAMPPLPDAPPADAFICSPGGSGCEMGDLVTCDGDAAPVTTDCPLGCTSAVQPARCQLLTPSNIVAAMTPDATCANPTTVDQDVPTGMTWNIDTSADCDATQPQTGAPELCIVIRHNIHVPATGTIRAVGPRALVLLATQDVVIEGTVDVSADHEAPGPGAAAPAGNGGNGDCGTAAGSLGERGQCSGGGGGHGEEGAAGSGTGTPGGGSPGGVVGGDSDLQPLTAGGNGGSNQEGESLVGGHGGALQISACSTLTLGAMSVVNAGGGGGVGGAGTGLLSLPANGGAGGGAGGGILLESPSIAIAGGANLAANGGGGGGGGGAITGTAPPGGPGGNGGLGTTAATGGAAGLSGAGVGGTGGTSAAPPTSGTAGSGTNGSGGGGGGLGRIRFHSLEDQTLNVSGATISPVPSKGPVVLQ